MIIAVDFDGTCAEHMYPEIGPVVPGAEEALSLFVSCGYQLILWTMRSGDTLCEAGDRISTTGLNHRRRMRTCTSTTLPWGARSSPASTASTARGRWSTGLPYWR